MLILVAIVLLLAKLSAKITNRQFYLHLHQSMHICHAPKLNQNSLGTFFPSGQILLRTTRSGRFSLQLRNLRFLRLVLCLCSDRSLAVLLCRQLRL